MSDERLYSTPEAAKFLGVSIRTFKYRVKECKIEPVQRGAKGAKFYSGVQLETLRCAKSRCATVQVCNSAVQISCAIQACNSVVQLSCANDGSEVQSPAVQKRGDTMTGVTKFYSLAQLTGVTGDIRGDTARKKVTQTVTPLTKGDTRENIVTGDMQELSPLVTPEVQSPAVQKRGDKMTDQIRSENCNQTATALEQQLQLASVYRSENCNQTATALQQQLQPVPSYSSELAHIKADLAVNIAPLKGLVKSFSGAWRGLPLEQLLKFNCRYILKWTPPKNRRSNPKVSERIIVPCSDESYLARLVRPIEHYNYDEREYLRGKEKVHAGHKRLFNPAALTSTEPVFVVEGYIDAMSVDLAGYPCVALGAADRGDLLVDAVAQMQPKPRIILLLDPDKTGRDAAAKLCKKLLSVDCPAVMRFLTEEDSKLDCNEILVTQGVDVLRGRLVAIVENSAAELADALNHKPEPEPKKSKPANQYDDQDDRARALDMLAVIPPAEVSYDEWYKIGMALKNIGCDVSVWDNWSRNDERYKEGECEYKWGTFDRESSDDKPKVTIATLHAIAKRYGYTGLKIPRPFAVTEHGIFVVKPAREEGDEPQFIPISRTKVLPTRRLVGVKSGVEYELAIHEGERVKHIEVAGRTISDTRAILDLANQGVLGIEAKPLVKFLNDYIALNLKVLPTVKTYSQPGWHESRAEHPFFVYPTGEENYIVRRAGFDYEAAFSTRGNADVWKKIFVEACEQGSAVARIFIGTALAAPLVKHLDVMNMQLHLSAPNDAGKTGLLKLTASIFGNPKELLKSFAATPKNRLFVAGACNDLPSFLDEMETMTGKQFKENLSTMIYEFAQGVGNQAQKRNGVARETFKFRGARVSTAERRLLKSNDQRGAFKRLVQIDTREKIFDADLAADLHAVTAKHFGLFGRTWTEFIATNLPAISEHFAAKSKQLLRACKDYEPTHIKSVVAAAIAIQYFMVCIEAQADFDESTYLDDVAAIADNHLPKRADMDDAARAIRDLSSFVAGHLKYFCTEYHPTDDDAQGNETRDNSQWAYDSYGKIFDDGSVAFLPHALREILEDKLHYASCDQLVDEFNARGLLTTDTGRRTHKAFIDGRRQRTYHFKAGKLRNDKETDEETYYDELGVTD